MASGNGSNSNDPYPPDSDQAIQTGGGGENTRRVCIYENERDSGAPWILHEVASDKELFIGLSDEQKAKAHEAIHNAIHETTETDRSMFR